MVTIASSAFFIKRDKGERGVGWPGEKKEKRGEGERQTD